MVIKRIEHLSEEECREYLRNNPHGELVTEVQARMNAILSAKEKYRQREDNQRKSTITLKNKWIDINQFLEGKKYRSLITTLLCLIILFVPIILLLWETANDPSPAIWFCIFLLISLRVTAMYHSPLIGEIYNIEDGTKADKYRPVQNEKDKCGLCKLGRTRIKKLLPFEYDLVCPAKENSFICCKDSKYGLYNADTQKMMIPVSYDNIYSMGDSVIQLIKNGEVYTFSYKGYRIIE